MINTICLLAERSQAKQTVTPDPASSAVSTPQSRYSPVSSVIESQSWQENGISRPESAVSQESRNVDTEETISETKNDRFRKMLINFLTEIDVPLTASLI